MLAIKEGNQMPEVFTMNSQKRDYQAMGTLFKIHHDDSFMDKENRQGVIEPTGNKKSQTQRVRRPLQNRTHEFPGFAANKNGKRTRLTTEWQPRPQEAEPRLGLFARELKAKKSH